MSILPKEFLTQQMWIGLAVAGLLVLGLLYMRGRGARREGFQTTPETPPVEIKLPKVTMEIAPENVPTTCLMLQSFYENMKNKVENAKSSNVPTLVKLIEPNLKELENQLRNLNCKMESAPSS